MSEFNKEQGTLASWVKGTLPKATHRWKLDEESGLILWNKMDSVTDLSSVAGPAAVKTSTPASAAGKFGNGVDFTADAQYYTFYNLLDISDRGSFDFWFKPHYDYTYNSSRVITSCPVAGQRIRLAWIDPAGDPGGFSLYFASAYVLSGPVHVPATTEHFVLQHAADVWMHIGLIWDRDGIAGSGDTVRLYIDGQLHRSSTYTLPALTQHAELRVGTNNTATLNQSANGVIDNFKVWNYAKTDFSDIETERTSQHLWAQPVDKGSLPVHGTNIGADIAQDGYRGKCYYFAGNPSDNYIDLNGTYIETRGSISCWFKTVNNTVKQYIFSDCQDGSNELRIFINPTGTLYFTGYVGGAQQFDISVSSAIDNDQWYHVCCTFDSEARVYLNGELVGSDSSVAMGAYTHTIPAIGARLEGTASEANYTMKGWIQDFRLWQDDILTHEQVRQLYQDKRYIISANKFPEAIHRWPLDKPFVEDIGLLDSTSEAVNDPPLSIDNNRKSYNFNGSTQYIKLGSNIISELGTSVTNISVAFWAKTDIPVANDGIFYLGTNAANDGEFMVYQGNQFVGVFMNISSFVTSVPSTDTDWHHWAVTYDGKRVKVYKDGVLASDVPFSIVLDFTGSIGRIANYYNDNQYYQGNLADMRLFHEAITSEHVKFIMHDNESFELKIDETKNALVPNLGTDSNGLVFWNTLSSQKDLDNSGVGPHLQTIGSTSFVSGQFNTAYKTLTFSNYLTVPTFPSSIMNDISKFTFEAWINTPWSNVNGQASDGGKHQIFQFFMDGSNRASWQLSTPNSNKAYLSKTIGGSQVNHAGANLNWAANTWTHIALVVDANGIDGTSDTVRMYVNGSQVYNSTTAHSPLVGVGILYFTRWISDDTRFFNGTVDNVKIWNYAKVDFSDRFVEYPSHILTPTLLDQKEEGAKQEAKGLVFWNTMGSYKEITNSRVGSDCHTVGNPVFATGKFGKGFDATSYLNKVVVEDLNYNINPRGTVELWIKFHNASPGMPQWNYICDESNPALTNRLAWLFNNDNIDVARNTYHFASSTIHNAHAHSAEEWVHMAYVWDEDGIDGTSDTGRIYTKGILHKSTTSAIPAGSSIIPGLSFGSRVDFAANEPINGVMDNIKVWSYAKTDFSDKDFEFPQELITKADSIDPTEWSHLALTWKQNKNDEVQDYRDSSFLVPFNNTFKDVAGNAMLSNFNGVVFNPQSRIPGTRSALFDGSSTYLTAPDSEAWLFGAKNFTVDWWQYKESDSSGMRVVAKQNGSTYWGFWAGNVAGNNYPYFQAGLLPGGYLFGATGVDLKGRWAHVAWVRNGDVMSVYVDGAHQEDFDCTGLDVVDFTADLNIGRWVGGGEYFDGSLAYLRITKNIARWTSDFDPPVTEADYKVSGLPAHGMEYQTKLYLPFNNSIDNKTSEHRSVINNGITFDAANKKVGSHAGIFTPSNYINVRPGEWCDLKDEDFTVDTWFRFDSIAAATYFLACQWDTAPNRGWNCYYDGNADELNLELSNDGTNITYLTYGGLVLNADQWYHVAWVRHGSTIRLFLDGVGLATYNYTDTVYFPSTKDVMVGAYGSTSPSTFFNGQIDSFRITKKALWLDDFTPPLSYNVATQQAKLDSPLKLLLPFDGDFIDKTGKHQPTPPAAVSLSPERSIVAANSVYFDGTAYLPVGHSSDWDFGNGDFTVDWWENRDDTSTRGSISREFGGSGYIGFLLGYASGGNLLCYYDSNGSSGWEIDAMKLSTGIDVGVWNHFAAVRKGNTFYTFKNGKLQTTVTSTMTLLAGTLPLVIGAYHTGYYFKGYMSYLRMTKGKALWIENFKPPTTEEEYYGLDYNVDSKLYLNGKLLNTSNAAGKLTEPDRHAIIGADSLKQNQAGLLFDKMLISKRQLSDSEIYKLYASKNIK